MNAPPFRLDRLAAEALRAPADHDDGRIPTLSIAPSTPRRWGLPVPSGRIVPVLMRPKQYRPVETDWEPHPPPGVPRRRDYRRNEAYRGIVTVRLRTQH